MTLIVDFDESKFQDFIFSCDEYIYDYFDSNKGLKLDETYKFIENLLKKNLLFSTLASDALFEKGYCCDEKGSKSIYEKSELCIWELLLANGLSPNLTSFGNEYFYCGLLVEKKKWRHLLLLFKYDHQFDPQQFLMALAKHKLFEQIDVLFSLTWNFEKKYTKKPNFAFIENDLLKWKYSSLEIDKLKALINKYNVRWLEL